MPSHRPPLLEDHPLAPLTSWKIGGPAALFAEPGNPEELERCLETARKRGLELFLLGGGSNVLISDRGFPGLVLRYADVTHTLEIQGSEARASFGARHSLARAARTLAADGWAGLEWAEGIPGTIGGAVLGNAGAFGGEIGSSLEVARVYLPGEGVRDLPAAACEFSYRGSRFRRRGSENTVILGATFRLRRDDPARLAELQRAYAERRRQNTPIGLSCGSVFKNPPGDSAGRLIEQAGLRGVRCGRAEISARHANYIVNLGGATAQDVLELMRRARDEVRRQHGLELELEVRLVGFPDPGL